MKCLLDLDGVLVDFVEGICSAHGHGNIYERPECRGLYGMETLMGMSANKFWQPCDESFWAGLPPTKDKDAILELVEGVFGIDNICLLTSPSANVGCATGKMRWIHQHMPDYQRRFLIGPRKEFCAHADSILIDDYDANVDKFREHGGKAILVPRPWNTLHYIDNPVAYLREQLAV